MGVRGFASCFCCSWAVGRWRSSRCRVFSVRVCLYVSVPVPVPVPVPRGCQTQQTSTRCSITSPRSPLISLPHSHPYAPLPCRPIPPPLRGGGRLRFTPHMAKALHLHIQEQMQAQMHKQQEAEAERQVRKEAEWRQQLQGPCLCLFCSV